MNRISFRANNFYNNINVICNSLLFMFLIISNFIYGFEVKLKIIIFIIIIYISSIIILSLFNYECIFEEKGIVILRFLNVNKQINWEDVKNVEILTIKNSSDRRIILVSAFPERKYKTELVNMSKDSEIFFFLTKKSFNAVKEFYKGEINGTENLKQKL